MNFYCVCMSPAIDSTISLKAWPRSGEIFKDVMEVETVGGKGLNVARGLALRGDAVTLGGLLGRENEVLFTRELERRGVRDAFLRVPGPTRRNEVVTTPQGQFKMNRRAFPGLAAGDCSPRAVLDRLLEVGGNAKPLACVLSGSLPPAAPAGFYADFAAELAAYGIETVLDASGEPLRAGVRARPAVIKPNTEECAELVGFAPAGEAGFARAARKLLESVRVAIISDGAGGCWFAEASDGARVWHASAPKVEVLDPTAAGDTLLAEFCHGYYPRRALTEEVMRRAVAAGSAACTRPGAEPPPAELIESLFNGVAVRAVPYNKE